jgi:L,D-transpeptidase catalytic domain/Putative peptidoglycan binding domain/Sporulation and spore germination
MASGARWLALVGFAAASLIAGCGGCGGEEEPTPQVSVDLYFTSGEQFHKVTRQLPAEGTELEVATEALLAGPTEAERTDKTPAQTTIPERVELVGASLDDGVARVALSDRFLAGVPRDAGQRSRDQQATLDARVGQLTYTLDQFEGVRAVAIRAGDLTVASSERPADYAKPAEGPLLFRPERERKPKKAAKTPGTRELQERLAKLHFLPKSAVDGVNGYRTQQAVLAFQAWNDLGRDGVVGPQTTAALATAHRPKPRASGPSHRIEVYRSKGVALLIEHGRLKRAIHVSSGGPATPTPAGRFEVFRKELRSWSVPFQVWLPYASYFNAGIAFHEYPDVPTYPASHGCVRVPAPEAKGVYEFASLGTVVVVI